MLSYVIVPVIRQYRHRYHQYLPLQNLTVDTTSLRQRVGEALRLLILPSTWTNHGRAGAGFDGGATMLVDDDGEDDDEDHRRHVGRARGRGGGGGGNGSVAFGDEEGEHMMGFDVDSDRREALERRRSNLGEAERRLSRDLEEGFRDDSDDGDDGDNGAENDANGAGQRRFNLIDRLQLRSGLQ